MPLPSHINGFRICIKGTPMFTYNTIKITPFFKIAPNMNVDLLIEHCIFSPKKLVKLHLL